MNVLGKWCFQIGSSHCRRLLNAPHHRHRLGPAELQVSLIPASARGYLDISPAM
ncbi:hypothetical protein PF003_g33941 [Phytophthora fragariae]|nr:hypothetical protein PF003_g33941 [Phytophthora fragariae]